MNFVRVGVGVCFPLLTQERVQKPAEGLHMASAPLPSRRIICGSQGGNLLLTLGGGHHRRRKARGQGQGQGQGHGQGQVRPGPCAAIVMFHHASCGWFPPGWPKKLCPRPSRGACGSTNDQRTDRAPAKKADPRHSARPGGWGCRARSAPRRRRPRPRPGSLPGLWFQSWRRGAARLPKRCTPQTENLPHR